jgi:hypothetical protein
LVERSESRYWHTTEAFKYGRRDAIAEMGRFLADRVEWTIVSVEATITKSGGMDEARQTCLSAAVREVTRGTGPDAVRLLVADRNKDDRLNRLDQRVVETLRSTGDINENVTLYHGRMRDEPMLWTADRVAWSTYRSLALDDTRWIAPMRDVMTVLDARTGLAVKMKQPQAAAANPGAQQSTGGYRGQSVVASGTNIPATDDPGEGFRRGTTVLDDFVARVAHLRKEAGMRGISEGNTPAALQSRLERVQRLRELPQTTPTPESHHAPRRNEPTHLGAQ